MSFGLRVWDAGGGEVFSIGKRYLRILGNIVFPEEVFTVHTSQIVPTAEANKTRSAGIAVPSGEQGVALLDLNSVPRARSLRIEPGVVTVTRGYTTQSIGPGQARVIFREIRLQYGFFA